MNEKQGGTAYCYVLDWDVKNVWEFIISLKRPEWSNRTYVLTRQTTEEKDRPNKTSNSNSSSSSSTAEEPRQQHQGHRSDHTTSLH